MKIHIAITLLVSVSVAHARIGESQAEITTHYGEGKRESTGRLPTTERFRYDKNGYDVDVSFLNGKSVLEAFHRKDQKISDDDIKEILKANADGHDWAIDEGSKKWMRDDQRIEAFREPGHSDFLFMQDVAAVKELKKDKSNPQEASNQAGLAVTAALLKTYRNSLVFVNGTTGAGSGFIAAMAGANFLVTNAHVAAGVRGAAFKTLDGAQVQGGAASIAVGHDIFRMQSPSGGKPFQVMQGVDENASIGDDILVLGNAEGAGVINPINGKIVGIGPNLVEVDAAFVPGNSGSPIIHLKSSQVIGVATYLIVKKYDAATKEAIKDPVVRRFGYRLDTVKAWQPVDWQAFYTQATEMDKIESLTHDLDSLLRNLAKNNRAALATYSNPVIKNRVDAWQSARSHRLSPSDLASANQNFIGFLKAACQSDIAAEKPRLSYDYFQRKIADQQQSRNQIAEVFDRIIRDLQTER